MTENWTEAEKDRYFAPGDSAYNDLSSPFDDETRDEYSTQSEFTLFDAPDYALFIRHTRTERGKEYEQKVASMLKAAALGAFKSGNIHDGCAIVHYGPSFAKKCGDLTDVSQGAAKAIDLLTTPDNPWVMFAAISVPFIMQLFRNHEQEARIVKKTWREERAERKRMKAEGLTSPREKNGKPFTVRLPFGRSFTVHVHIPTPRVILRVFYAQTKNPADLTTQVLSDTRLIKALEKEGIQFIKKRNPSDAG